MLWIEDIVENTSAPPFLINSKVAMIGFVDPQKVVVRSSAFLAFRSARNEFESEN